MLTLENDCPFCEKKIKYDGKEVVAIGPGGWPDPELERRAIHRKCFTPYSLLKTLKEKKNESIKS